MELLEGYVPETALLSLAEFCQKWESENRGKVPYSGFLEKLSQQHPPSEILQSLKPWRKGPFKLGDVAIDSEWRCDMKWDRIRDKIHPLKGRRVGDIGCGNGYYLWRMQEEGAEFVIGMDPQPLYYAQFLAVSQFLTTERLGMLPIGLEDSLGLRNTFDTLFCMGVLYHKPNPVQFLKQLKSLLASKGELILETLMVRCDSDYALFPKIRYAQMKNVYFIPSVRCLENWLERAGFSRMTVLSEAVTTSEEQRATSWSSDQSLKDFLDPADTSKTVEGYPAPIRLCVSAVC